MNFREDFGLHGKARSVDFRTVSMKDAGIGLKKTSWLFHRITLFFANRKFIAIAFIHLAITMVIFTHFAMEKFNFQKSKVPATAPFYTWKIGVPTFEFGTMHAILYQLGTLPLTMCRLIISKASNTFFNTIIPFNESLKCHIAIGYTLVVMLFFTIVVFLMFFGVNCADGNQAFCAKFTSEIMITGYVIFAFFVSVAVTSYLRTVIPYRFFYIYHHLVFVTYAITIAHTIDHVQRNKGGRSQTFKWFTASILLYITDRASMYLNQRYKTKILLEDSCIVTSTDGKKMIILEVKKPDLFYFYPGQYVYLKIPSVDNIWHPFSVASSAEASKIVFYIEVFGEKSWTGKLFSKLNASIEIDRKDTDTFDLNIDPDIYDDTIEVMGPYGTSLGQLKEHSHGLIIGAGTGIVPILSLFQTHVGHLLSLDAAYFEKEKQAFHAFVTSLHLAKKKQGSLVSLMYGNRQSIEEGGENVGLSNWKLRFGAYFHIYKYFSLFFGTILGVLVVGTAISWNLLTFEAYEPMRLILSIGALVFQAHFLLTTMTIQEVASIWFYIDVIVIILSALADWNFFASNLWGRFQSMDLFIFMILTTYMTFRNWTTLLKSQRNLIQSARKRSNYVDVLEKAHLVWTTRSPTLVSQMFPDFEQIWKSLVDKFGEEFTSKVCEITIYCTSKDREACEELKVELKDYALFRKGALKFQRPNFKNIFEDHTGERIEDTSLPVSRTLVAFCGSPQLADHVKEVKIVNDLAMFAAGVDEHQMDQAIESYGGVKKKEKQPARGTTMTFEDTEELTMKNNCNVSTRKSMKSMRSIMMSLSADSDDTDNQSKGKETKRSVTFAHEQALDLQEDEGDANHDSSIFSKGKSKQVAFDKMSSNSSHSSEDEGLETFLDNMNQKQSLR